MSIEELYVVYNKGYNLPYPEWQVEFERNTRFVVNQIEPKENYTKVYISEYPYLLINFTIRGGVISTLQEY